MSEPQQKQRGAWLTFWLILMLLGNGFLVVGYTIVGYILATNTAVINNPFSPLYNFVVPLWAVILFLILSIVNLCSVFALFKWRKWGFFVLCATTPIIIILNIARSGAIDVLAVGEGIAGIVILYILLSSRWNLLR